jgi:hypothetical protein
VGFSRAATEHLFMTIYVSAKHAPFIEKLTRENRAEDRCHPLGTCYTGRLEARIEFAQPAVGLVTPRPLWLLLKPVVDHVPRTQLQKSSAASRGSQIASHRIDFTEANVQMTKRRLIFCIVSLACLTQPALSMGQDTKSQSSDETLEPADFNRKIYYKNKLEVSLDAGWHPYNTPFIFTPSDRPPRDYTLVPLIVSLRWHLDDIRGPWFLRGNTDFTVSGSYTVIPRGPESHYAAFMMGLRRNFVRPSWRIVPYLGGHVGLGFVDAKGPEGVPYEQGQDFTFNFIMGGGVRYNFSTRYSISAGIEYMHISNLYLSEPQVINWGINVVGPTFGISRGLGKLR